MNDQLKPATNPYYEAHFGDDQPKPTGEWQWQHEEIYAGDTYIGCARTDSDAHDIVAAHNAQIADEREKLEQEAKELELQLAAALKEAVLINALISEQTKQLATERERTKTLVDTLKVAKRHLEATTQALGEFTTSDDVAVLIQIDAALAQVKELEQRLRL